MSIYQTNVFICEVCGKIESCTHKSYLYSDPIINPPDGWGYDDENEDKLSCNNCMNIKNIIK